MTLGVCWLADRCHRGATHRSWMLSRAPHSSVLSEVRGGSPWLLATLTAQCSKKNSRGTRNLTGCKFKESEHFTHVTSFYCCVAFPPFFRVLMQQSHSRGVAVAARQMTGKGDQMEDCTGAPQSEPRFGVPRPPRWAPGPHHELFHKPVGVSPALQGTRTKTCLKCLYNFSFDVNQLLH